MGLAPGVVQLSSRSLTTRLWPHVRPAWRHRRTWPDSRECLRGASNHSSRSKVERLQELQPPVHAIITDAYPVSASTLARVVIKPVKNAGCECGGGRGRISAERRTLLARASSRNHLERP